MIRSFYLLWRVWYKMYSKKYLQRGNSNNTFWCNTVHNKSHWHYSEDNFWAIPLFFLQILCAYCQNTLFHLHCCCQIPWIKLIEIMMFWNKYYMFIQHDIFFLFFSLCLTYLDEIKDCRPRQFSKPDSWWQLFDTHQADAGFCFLCSHFSKQLSSKISTNHARYYKN